MKTFGIVLMVFVFALTGLVFAADPQFGNKGKMCFGVEKGEVVEITGVIVKTGHQQSIVVETTLETLQKIKVKIHGIGPNWYWEANGIDKPDIGETVTVKAFAVPFADPTRYLAAVITIGEVDTEGAQTIELRDLTTGCPLWRNFDHH
jgi:hypothetical protein